MKNYLFLITLLFFAIFTINSQEKNNREKRNAKIKVLKIAFLTEKLNLTTNEAEKFWPIYNIYSKKIHVLERVEKYKLASKIKQDGGIDAISEDEAKLIIAKIKEIDTKTYTTKVEFDKKLTKILSYKKILLLKTSEKEFIRNLMRKYRRNKK